MSKRIISINTPGTYLCEKDHQLELWQERKLVSKVPLVDLGVLMIENSACTITGTLLASLARNDVVVSICDHHHLPIALLHPVVGVSLHAVRTRTLAELAQPRKKQAWKQIISCKIKFQSQVVQHSPNTSALLSKLSSQVTSGDLQNREATAAGYYWKVVFDEFVDLFKRSEVHPINSSLNYGYAVVRAAISRSLISSGLTPLFGIFHKSRDNPFALADDLLEVYRPFVDLYLLSLLRKNKLDLSEPINKREILRILTSSISMNRESKPFLSAIDSTVASLVHYLDHPHFKLAFPDQCKFLDTD
ncbi:type II CRISPR-associated endonuclease Cas1 [bacterium]|nr:type II CRISPR-associated endonuclease Cas1 [bacterium]